MLSAKWVTDGKVKVLLSQGPGVLWEGQYPWCSCVQRYRVSHCKHEIRVLGLKARGVLARQTDLGEGTCSRQREDVWKGQRG